MQLKSCASFGELANVLFTPLTNAGGTRQKLFFGDDMCTHASIENFVFKEDGE